MKNNHCLKLLSLILVFTITACQETKNNETTTENNQTKTEQTTSETKTETKVQGKVIQSKDGKVQVTVPDNWETQTDLNEKADLQVANTSEENYLIVLSDAKADLKNLNLEDHAKLTRGFIEKAIKVSSISEGKSLQINGKPAIQYEIKGEVNGMNIVYLHTTVETDNYFHQILAWTLPSQFVRNEPILEAAIESFQEN